MRLSILIPTHNRPTLFTRCLSSVLNQIPNDVEVIVNNDSNDIVEINHPKVTYHYQSFDNLSAIYKFLLDQASGEYIYYLEDDDYLASDFFQKIQLDADIIAGNYCPTYLEHKLEHMRLFQDGVHNPGAFLQHLNLEHLQLSQFIFRRNLISGDFPTGNNIHNDIHLVFKVANRSSKIRTLNRVLYYQTIDGGDNLSFTGVTTTQVNITQSMDFLNEFK